MVTTATDRLGAIAVPTWCRPPSTPRRSLHLSPLHLGSITRRPCLAPITRPRTATAITDRLVMVGAGAGSLPAERVKLEAPSRTGRWRVSALRPVACLFAFEDRPQPGWLLPAACKGSLIKLGEQGLPKRRAEPARAHRV